MIRRRKNGKRPSLVLANNCEWDPGENRHANDDDHHHGTTRAAVIVGARGQWRLCESCAHLAPFVQFRTWEWIP